MAYRKISRKQLGMAANHITLAHFTETSVTRFLHEVAELVINKVAPRGGDSPWFPSWSKDHPNAVMVPARDGGEPFVFNLLTHGLVTRCIVAADPANLIDQADLMHRAAESSDNTLRLLNLRIAARWNYAMHLEQEKLLDYEEMAADLPGNPEEQGVPTEVVDRNRVTTNQGEIFLESSDGTRSPAGRFATPEHSDEQPVPTQL